MITTEKMKNNSTKIYVLLQDTAMTLRSCAEPIGIAVKTKEEAEEFMNEGHYTHFKDYEEVELVEKYEPQNKRPE